MSTAERRAREKESRRRRILDAARELFVAHGYAGVTLRKIAEAIEYAPGTVYSYFRDKDDLVRALCLADFESFEQSIPRREKRADPLAALKAIGGAYIRFALTHPNHYRLMFMTPAPITPDERALEKKGDPARDGYALLLQTVRQAIDERRLRPEYRDAELVAQTLWAGVHGMASLQIAMGHNDWIEWTALERRIDAMLDALVFGLARPSRRAPGASA